MRFAIFFSRAILSSRAPFLLLARWSSREEGIWYFGSTDTVRLNDMDAKRSSHSPMFSIVSELKLQKYTFQICLNFLEQTRAPRSTRVGEWLAG